MEDFKITGFEHTAIYAKKERMEEVIDFYVNFMGFEKTLDQIYEQYDGYRMVFLVKNGFLIELCTGEENYVPGTIEHLCFKCVNLTQGIEKLKEMGYKVEKRTDVTRSNGSKASMQFFVGPVGERIELYEEF